MGTLLFIRHGQASFGADDYDQLSPLGQTQCRAVGRYLAERDMRPDVVLSGTLRRHAQSWQALAGGLAESLAPAQAQALPSPSIWRELDEYDSTALMAAMPPGEPLPPPQTADGFKAHFRHLRKALAAWIEGRIAPEGMPSHDRFRDGIRQVLDHVAQNHVGRIVVVVSSGGPISTVVSEVLGTPPSRMIDLNMRMRNSSITELVFNARGHQLVSFNAVPHLESPERRPWITHA